MKKKTTQFSKTKNMISGIKNEVTDLTRVNDISQNIKEQDSWKTWLNKTVLKTF